jgi:hypothetical protein
MKWLAAEGQEVDKLLSGVAIECMADYGIQKLSQVETIIKTLKLNEGDRYMILEHLKQMKA